MFLPSPVHSISNLYSYTPLIISKSPNSCHDFSSPPYPIMYCINLLKMAQLLHLYVCHFFCGPTGHSSPETEQQRVYFFNVPISGSDHNTYLNITSNEFIYNNILTLSKIHGPLGSSHCPRNRNVANRRFTGPLVVKIRGFRDLNYNCRAGLCFSLSKHYY